MSILGVEEGDGVSPKSSGMFILKNRPNWQKINEKKEDKCCKKIQ